MLSIMSLVSLVIVSSFVVCGHVNEASTLQRDGLWWSGDVNNIGQRNKRQEIRFRLRKVQLIFH